MAAPTRPRLIVSDLDGTFLSGDGTVCAENAAAVAAAQEAGIPVVFATGRPVRWLRVIADLPGAHPIVIASNGAALYDLVNETIMERSFVAPDIALAAVGKIRDRIPGTSFGVETGERFGYELSYAAWLDDDLSDPSLFCGTAEEIIAAGEFVKLLVQNSDLDPDVLAAEVSAVVGDSLNVTHSAVGEIGLAEVSARGVSKASMLARYCQKLQIDASEVAAFGDMPNDLDMLTWAGMPHVVANAHPALLNSGARVVASNDNAGVGRTILEWLN